MTDEQRLDRLERIVKLMIKAGLRARKAAREQDEKINILIDSQMRTDERIAALASKTDERFAKTDERLAALSAKTDERLADMATSVKESIAAMAASEARTEERLKSFMETVERVITERRNGNP